MIQSRGVLVKQTTLWQGSPSTFPGWDKIGLGTQWLSYGELYRRQLWVNVLVQKLARAHARLPLKVYEHDKYNRPEAPDHPYALLLKKPNPRWSPFYFWLYLSSTFDVYGEAFFGKLRDPGGRPYALVPFHPSGMRVEEEKDGRLLWTFDNGTVHVEKIPAEDIVHPHTYNPDDPHRGLSNLEPLRRTLEFEDAAQRAQSAFWRKGSRPSMTLEHPKVLSTPAADRLKLQWDQLASGADNTGVAVVLEEGMKATAFSISAEEAQYIESRKLNREEVCAEFDVPPPVVHILDRATFSNITEQMRSMYRDTMAPRLKFFEAMLEHEVRSSVRPGFSDPDFGDSVYSEFLLDEVLRGDFEARATAYQQADWLTIAEKRAMENKPFIEGTDRLFVNAATVPLEGTAYQTAAALIRAGFDAAAVLVALDLPPIAHTGNLPVNVQADDVPPPPAQPLRSLLGRVSRYDTLADIDIEQVVDGLGDRESVLVRAALNASLAVGEDIAHFRRGLVALSEVNA